MREKIPSKGIVILAHTPPPHHGQSLMVQLLLEELGKNPAVRFFHIDCRYSEDLASMGRFGIFKILRALRFAFQAMALRFKHGATTLYFVPAPGKRPAFYRDCLVLSLLRPFFPSVIFHWHAAGLSHWLENQASPLERRAGRKIYSKNKLSIVLLEEKAAEAAYFSPVEIRVIPNGIPDPCPNFEPKTTECDRSVPVRLLFLSTATKEKGAFSAVTIWRRLNERALQSGGRLYHLTIAGGFPNQKEAVEFESLIERDMACLKKLLPEDLSEKVRVEVVGEVRGTKKIAAYSDCDIFIFPSTYAWESFGVVLVEAAHFGLPCVTYQPLVGNRGLSPELHSRVPFGDEEAFIAAVESTSLVHAREIRADAMAKFNVTLFGKNMRAAFQSIDA